MRDSSTLKAHFLPAFALSRVGVPTTCFRPFYVIHASDLWTPLKVLVCLNVDILLEFQILFKNLFRPKVFDVILSEFLIAVEIHTFDLVNLTICDF